MENEQIKRQIARCTDEAGTLDVEALTRLVAAAYDEKDLERRRSDRASRLMTRELDEALDAINLQNLRFKAALDNMSQGLCLYDSDGKLAVCNRRFLKIHGFTGIEAQPGLLPRELLEMSTALGTGEESRRPLIEAHLALDPLKGGTIEQVWPGERCVSITRCPVSDGGYLDTVADITETRLASARIVHLARHDALTDLPNRLLLAERLGEVLNLVRRGGKSALLYLDLDRFKMVNDTLGHPVGDALLIAVSQRLRRTVRAEDTVARLGGDEFAIIQYQVQSVNDPSHLARRIIAELAAPFDLDGTAVEIGVSIGIEMIDGDRLDQDDILRNADLALYCAKTNGRGGFFIFEPSLHIFAANRRKLEIDLRAALDESQFEIYYQPQVELKSGAIRGFEALVRWNHPTRGLMEPEDFIPILERTGLIDQLGDFVMLTACRDAMRWPTQINVSVNLSAAQFKSNSLPAMVESALRTSGLSGYRLELEVTENAVLDDPASVLDQLTEIKKLEVRVTLDEFGTGRSTLGYLRRFLFDRIKIDKRVIRDLGERGGDLAIVRAMTGICGSLGMNATADGVETEDQLSLLIQENCGSVQGSLFGKAVPLARTFDQIKLLGWGQEMRNAG